MSFNTIELIKAVKGRTEITATTIVEEIRARTNLDQLLGQIGLTGWEVAKLCHDEEQSSTAGADLKRSLSEKFDTISTGLDKQGISLAYGNVSSRCTPLALEFVLLALDPQFATEFEAYASVGPAPTDQSRYSHGPVRDLPDLVGAFLEALASRASGPLAARLHEGGRIARNELR